MPKFDLLIVFYLKTGSAYKSGHCGGAKILVAINWYIDNQSWWEKILSNKYDLSRLGSK